MSISALQNIIGDSQNIVFFGGAGVSTESGIPDFRSVDGLYSQRHQHPPETILSRTFFDTHTEEFFRMILKVSNISSLWNQERAGKTQKLNWQ